MVRRWMALAGSILLVGAFMVETQAQADCLAEYQALNQQKIDVKKQGAVGAGAGAVGTVGAAVSVVLGMTGWGTLVLVAVAAGGWVLAIEKSHDGQEITDELDVLKLYNQSSDYLTRSASDTNAKMPSELSAFARAVAQGDAQSETKVPQMIKAWMDEGVLCSDGKPLDAVGLYEAIDRSLGPVNALR